jgi:riboflavin biosynthesis pyrimidine reductase
LIRSLLEEDIVDEMVLTSVPVTIGRGTSLWGFDTKGKKDYQWSVSATETVGKGMVKTTYKRTRKKGVW